MLRPALLQRSILLARQYSSSRPLGLTRMERKPLDSTAGPMVWIDCEMTGLNPEKDKILEIGVLITNGNLELVDDGLQYVIRKNRQSIFGPEEYRMDEWCTKQHGESGLTQACLSSPYTRDYVAKAVLAYVKRWVPNPRTAVLAGNSVHADRSFLVKEMPELVDWLHYRIVDVSSIKELARRWYTHPSQKVPLLYESSHRALSDIRGSIKELEWYRKYLFVTPKEDSGPPRAS